MIVTGNFGKMNIVRWRFLSFVILLALSTSVVLLRAGLIGSLLSLELLFFMFVPGYVTNVFLFKRVKLIDILFLSVGMSLGLFISIDILLPLLLGRGSGLPVDTMAGLIVGLGTSFALLAGTISRIKPLIRRG
ncbi:MAG: hypothetical protein V3U49_00200 [Nitrososphaerales archaeon]